MAGLNEAWMALAGTIFGGSGLKIVESYLGRNRNRDDTATKLRSELRSDNAELRDELDKAHNDIERLEATVDDWREKYYSLIAKLAGQGIVLDE